MSQCENSLIIWSGWGTPHALGAGEGKLRWIHPGDAAAAEGARRATDGAAEPFAAPPGGPDPGMPYTSAGVRWTREKPTSRGPRGPTIRLTTPSRFPSSQGAIRCIRLRQLATPCHDLTDTNPHPSPTITLFMKRR